MQILPGLYLVNGFPYGQHQNRCVIRTGASAVMVDSGDLAERETFDLMAHNCARWSLNPADVSHFFITHAHFDHSSHAARLKSLGAAVVCNADCAAAIASGNDRCIGYAVHRAFQPCSADIVVRDGDTVDANGPQVRCIEAPGHADSCVVYEIVLNGERLWFAGDILLVGMECQSLELGWAGGPGYDPRTYLRTLEHLCHMPCDHLFPGHGSPCIGQGRRLVEDAYTKAMQEWR